MLSFHNDQAVKDKYVGRVRAHMEADNLIKGTGWENGKGCAVGCTLENYDHARYPIELGLPEWLARLEDSLFEGMTLEKSKSWPKDFLESIPLGVSEERFNCEVKAPFLVTALESTLETFDHKKFPRVKYSIDGSIALWKRHDIGSDDWKVAAEAAAEAAAAEAAEAAAEAAARAAWAAAWAAWAAGAAEVEAMAVWAAAEAAAEAAEAAEAARAVWAAAWAAGAVRYDQFADELLKLLRGLGSIKEITE